MADETLHARPARRAPILTPVATVDESVISERLATLSLEQKVRLLTGATFWTLHDEPTVGLEKIVVSDGPAGVRGQLWDERDSSANLPSPTSLAASWDVDLVFRLGELIASEARRKGVGVVLGPTVNIHRSPRGGRHFEAYSEDPWLSGVVGTAFVQGVQSCGIAATPKHYVANDSETDRMTVNVNVDERTLREVYLAPFERIVKVGGAWAVMSSYNSVAGATMTENDLLFTPLKDEWGFDGVVISDWMAVRDTIAAGNSGQDLAMPGPDGVWGQALIEAVRGGTVKEEAINDKVRRILRLAARLGALEGISPIAAPSFPWEDDHVSALLREAAADGMVLVRNEGVLPVDTAEHPKIAVIGHQARFARTQGGGSATVFPGHVVSPLEGIQSVFGEENVHYAQGTRPLDGLTAVDESTVVDPVTGAPGLHVTFLDSDGTALLDEHRATGRLTWLGDPILAETDTVDVLANFVAPEDGLFELGFAGLGDFRFTVDGATLSDGMFFPEGMDPFMAFLSPPQQSFPIQLTKGQILELRLQHRPQRQEGLAAVMFTLCYAEPFGDDGAELERAIGIATGADIAVVVVGTDEKMESEGFDRGNLRLPEGQDDLVRRVIAANPRTVVVVNSGGPVMMPWYQEAAAVLLTWFPGQEFGDALGDVLSGLREPGGRMPTTWSSTEGDVPVWQVEPVDGQLFYNEGLNVGYREWARRQKLGGPAPAIPFGHGLGYTQWALGKPRIEVAAPEEPTAVMVNVVATNTGARPGKQVVQVYLSRESESGIERPTVWLAGYAVVRAEPGDSVHAQINIEPRAFSYWSVSDSAWKTEPGEYRIHVGTSVECLTDSLVFDVSRGVL